MAMFRSLGSTSLTTRSPILMTPALGCSSPAMMASSVDFPQPDGPSSTMNSPSSTASEIPSSTDTAPKVLRTSSIVRRAMAASFERAGGEATHEVLAAEEVDEQRGQRRHDHG